MPSLLCPHCYAVLTAVSAGGQESGPSAAVVVSHLLPGSVPAGVRSVPPGTVLAPAILPWLPRTAPKGGAPKGGAPKGGAPKGGAPNGGRVKTKK